MFLKLKSNTNNNMTNEEKAREIAKMNQVEYSAPWGDFVSFSECEMSALEMAKWKDDQFKKCLERKKNELFNSNICLNVEPFIDFIDEIINEYFSEENK